jgi:hypothetical protein
VSFCPSLPLSSVIFCLSYIISYQCVQIIVVSVIVCWCVGNTDKRLDITLTCQESLCSQICNKSQFLLPTVFVYSEDVIFLNHGSVITNNILKNNFVVIVLVCFFVHDSFCITSSCIYTFYGILVYGEGSPTSKISL